MLNTRLRTSIFKGTLVNFRDFRSKKPVSRGKGRLAGTRQKIFFFIFLKDAGGRGGVKIQCG